MLDVPYDDDFLKVLKAEQRASNAEWRATHAQHADEDTPTGEWSPVEDLLPTEVETTAPHRELFARPLLSRAERVRVRAAVDHVHEASAGLSVSAVALFAFTVLMLVYAPDWRATLLGVSVLLIGWVLWSLRRATRTLQGILRREGGA